jgi:hypothetical protein
MSKPYRHVMNLRDVMEGSSHVHDPIEREEAPDDAGLVLSNRNTKFRNRTCSCTTPFSSVDFKDVLVNFKPVLNRPNYKRVRAVMRIYDGRFSRHALLSARAAGMPNENSSAQ